MVLVTSIDVLHAAEESGSGDLATTEPTVKPRSISRDWRGFPNEPTMGASDQTIDLTSATRGSRIEVG